MSYTPPRSFSVFIDFNNLPSPQLSTTLPILFLRSKSPYSFPITWSKKPSKSLSHHCLPFTFLFLSHQLTQRTWIWVSSGSWWWTGKPGVLYSMGSQRVGHDWATELNWTSLLIFFLLIHSLFSFSWTLFFHSSPHCFHHTYLIFSLKTSTFSRLCFMLYHPCSISQHFPQPLTFSPTACSSWTCFSRTAQWLKRSL